MATCEIFGAFAVTEPKHGSDVVALETRARRQGDEWVLDGQKRWIRNDTVADVVVVWARDDDDGQVGAFVVEHSDGAEHPVPGYHARTPRESHARPCRKPDGLWRPSGAERVRSARR
jgi:glutaryl-CoA dehydrogenase